MTDQTLADFAKNLVPQPYDKSTVSGRRASIESTLKSELGITALAESGSWSHGTSVAGNSDVDYMAYLAFRRPVLPSTALAKMKTALTGSNWQIQSLRISSPTVKVGFYSAPHFEVVPAYYKENKSDIHVFQIPGPGDEWVDSIPLAHNTYVSAVNDRLNKKVKNLVRLVKAWKYHTGAPVSSFYLEMRTAQYASGEDAIIYDVDLRAVFRRLISTEMKQMNDPLGVVSRITATSSELNRLTSLRLARAALTSLQAADAAKTSGNAASYWSSMTDVFGLDYPWPSW